MKAVNNEVLVRFGCFFRIVDGLPITWCYQTLDQNNFCSTGFPMGCKKDSKSKDACNYLVILKLYLYYRNYVQPDLELGFATPGFRVMGPENLGF